MKSKDEKRFQFMGNVVMIIMTILAVAPLLLVIISSFTDNNTLIRNGYSYFPEKFSLDAYHYIFVENPQVLKAYLVSFRLTAVGTVLSLSVTTLLAYAISKKELPARGVLTFYVFFTMLFNGGLVPTYINYVNIFHIKDTFWGLLLPGLVTNGFNVLLMKSYFTSSIPDEIVEAAYIDGASETQTFLKVVVPLAKPIIATIGLFAGIAYWNDWNNGYVYLNNRYLLQKTGSVFDTKSSEQDRAEYSISAPVRRFQCGGSAGESAYGLGAYGDGDRRRAAGTGDLSIRAE